MFVIEYVLPKGSGYMKKYEKAKNSIILNGYSDTALEELTNGFIEEFLDNEYERISDFLDKYIDTVKRGEILPNEFNALKFALVVTDNVEEENYAVSKAFKNVVVNSFNSIARMEPLQTTLISGNAMKYYKDLDVAGSNPYFFNKNMFASFDSSDLCSIHPLGHDFAFIRLSDLMSMLNNKGLGQGFLLVENSLGMSFDLILEYEAIMLLGEDNELKLKRV